MKGRDLFGMFFLGFIGILLWLLSKSLHNDYREPDRRIYMPRVFHLILGKPGLDGTHNLSGIYGQAITALMVIVFTLFNLGRITRSDAIDILIIGAIIFIVFMEIVRIIQKLFY